MSQQTPYIGCKISLISMLDIRYEGILHSVNSEKSTISLSKVRSFGTEDRPTVHAVPPRDEVYEFIIFKATDIKDLVVCSSASGLDYDPAILSVSSAPDLSVPSSQLTVPAGDNKSVEKEDVALPSGNFKKSSGYADAAHANATAMRGGFGQGRRGAPPVQMTAPQAQTATTMMVDTVDTAVIDNAVGGGVVNTSYAAQAAKSNYRQQSFHATGGAPSSHGGGGGGNHGQMNRRGQITRGQRAPPFQHHNFNHHSGNNTIAGGGGSHGHHANAAKDRLKFDSDFDFEEANEKFKEQLGAVVEQLAKANVNEDEENVKDVERSEISTPIGEIDAETFYDKRASFFDNISCESLEKTEGKNNRPDWKKERMTNQETFGHSAVRSLAFRRGARGFVGSGHRYQPNQQQQQHYHYNNSNYGGEGYRNNNYHRGGGNSRQPHQHYGGGFGAPPMMDYGSGGGGGGNNRYYYNNNNSNSHHQGGGGRRTGGGGRGPRNTNNVGGAGVPGF